MNVSHVRELSYQYYSNEPGLDEQINAVIEEEQHQGNICLGVVKVCEDGITESQWLLLFGVARHQ